MIQFENHKLIRNIIVLSLVMIHFNTYAQQGGPTGMPQVPVSNISVPTSGQSATNSNTQKADQVDTKYSEYQSICRNEIKTSENAQEAFSKDKEATLLSSYQKDKSSDNFKIIFNYYYDHSKVDELKSLFLNESKNLKAIEIVYYDSKIKFLRKKHSEVIAALNKQLEETPDNDEFLIMLAESYKEINNIYEAKNIYQDLFKKKKKDNEKYILNLCALETTDSSHGEAEAICKQAAKAFPQNETPRIYLGITYREETDLDKAIEQFKMANNIKPTEFGLTCLAETYALKQDYNNASDWYKKSFELDPKSGRAILGLALNAVTMKQFDAALEHFKKACDLDKKTSLKPLKETYKKVEDLKLKVANQYYAEIQRCSQK